MDFIDNKLPDVISFMSAKLGDIAGGISRRVAKLTDLVIGLTSTHQWTHRQEQNNH